MADEGATEIDFLPPGMGVDTLGKGPYLQNLERRGDAWHVRRGFGQVAQFDTTFAFDNVTVERHLGSAYMKTDFGHEQVISAFRVSTFSGSLFMGSDARDTGQYLAAYLITIHDLTTHETWEEMLHPRTAGQIADVERRHGLYETSRDESFEDYTTGDEKPFFFRELADTLYFGSRRAGLWAYFPATFRGTRTQQVNGHDRRDWLFRGPCESSLLVQATPANGIFSDGYAYLGTANFPKADAVVPFLNRLAFLDGRVVYFSDPGRPTSIISLNFVQIPSENDLTAAQEIGGNLLLFTESETFLYQPSTGVLLSGGRLTKAPDHVGCANPNAVTSGGGLVAWVDARSAYVTSNGLDIKDIGQSEDEVGMREFWRSAVSNPLTAYYQQAGFTNLASDQPRIQHAYRPEGAHVVYDDIRDAFIFGFPEIAFALTFARGRWTVWNFESVAAAANTVRALRNIRSPWFLMGENDLFVVGSSENAAITDASTMGGTPGGSAGGENVTVGSWYLLRYGRGGGLDRSISYDVEDVRRISGKVYSFDAVMSAAGAQSAFYVGEWIKVPTGWTFPNGATPATARTYLLPVDVVPGQTLTNLPDRLTLIVRFDNLLWVPFLRTGTAEVDFLLPSERLESAPGYSPGAPVIGSSEVQVYNSGTGLVSATGNELRLRWNGGVAGYVAASPYQPNINLNLRQRNPLIYLPFRYIGSTAMDAMSLGLRGVTATIERVAGAGPYTANAEVLAWQQAQFNNRHSTDAVAQPVDWIIKSDQIGLRGKLQLLLRTIYLKLRSHGSATTVVPTGGSVFGLLNVLIGSDWKGWTSQIVDYEGNLDDVANVQTIRSRLRNAAAAMVTRAFEGGNARWGDPTVSTRGNYLVDDEQVDTVAVSDVVKGEHVEVMLFGHVRNTAEALAFDSAKAVVRPTSGRRRRGR